MAAPGERKSDGFVAKAAGVAVVGGIAWSVIKSMTLASSSSSSVASPVSSADPHKQIYHVAPGDTLFSISHRFGVSVDDLKGANRVQGAEIFVGDELVIPVSSVKP